MYPIYLDLKIDFIPKMRVAALISLVLIVIGIASLLIHHGPNWGVEFVGGTEVQLKFQKSIDTDVVRNIMEGAGYPAESVQQLGLQQDKEYLLRFSPDVVDFDKIELFKSGLNKLIDGNDLFRGATVQRIDYIGPKIGKELIRKAFIAIILGWVGIMLYLMIRFKFSFALGAVIAIIHDILITLGAIFLADKEFTLVIVAALLTVIGYSVNDTIVIFDRIRENLGRAQKIGFRELVSESLNQTLSRTILTYFTVLLVLIALFLLGGSVIHDFAFTLIVGITAGTYSSIFMASAFLIYWHGKKASSA